MSTPELITTADGSHTLYMPHLDEHYHSINGAIAEAVHVYLEAGYLYAAKHFERPSILEVGFGTGLNCLLTMLSADTNNQCIDYTGIELFPLLEEELVRLNYPQCLGQSAALQWWSRIHHGAGWNVPVSFPEGSTLLKWHGDVAHFEGDGHSFHVVYFDAFAPQVQPELWTEGMFQRISSMMVSGGVLVTYSSKGDVRRALTASGFAVEKIPGPDGKREMVRARKR